jgi:hypothetical protein
MLMVIFGAGASYDSDSSRAIKSYGSLEHRPPLADELFAPRGLFDEVLSKYPECHPIIPILRAVSATRSVEQMLEEFQTEITAPVPYPERAVQLSAVRFYLREILALSGTNWTMACKGITNYVTLLDEIARWKNEDVLLVTFNYDAILEQALGKVTGKEPDSVDRYLSVGRFSLVKIHGSVTWARCLEGNILHTDPGLSPAQEMIRRGTTLQLSENFEYIGHSPGVEWLNRNKVMRYPSIAIPVQTKRQFECPISHLDRLKSALPSVKRVLVVGWRGMDAHFVELLREHLGGVRIQFICGGINFAREVAQRLLDAGVHLTADCREEGFSDYVTSRVGQDFLKG